MSVFHSDLKMGRFLPPLDIGPRMARLANRMPVRSPAPPRDMIISDLEVPGPEGAPAVDVRMYRPASATGEIPVLVWMHGGGMILGNHLSEEDSNVAFARELGIAVVSVNYRLAPQSPAPAAVEDCYAVMEWLVANATELAIDPQRIALGGASAGGGLAAATALLAYDSGRIRPAFQLLVYPMLDDRTVLRRDMDTTHARFWRPKSNRYAWGAYLGAEAGGDDVSDYAAPARRTDLSGLPPAWIGVGTLDLFHAEDVDYAERLQRAGTAVDLVVVEGAFHGFDVLFKKKPVSRRFWEAQRDALGHALFGSMTLR
ncbi:alpha/beta hydrolase [Cryobacterium sp. N22]|uniref:alpha/beta hydrolase n=1 Tax=Cryobacterium sp. N22 TaxID=2048290 RepID=UPI001E6542DD|nr:alpha/beta hydrolase [Cryobacterium sp. N22]